MIKKRLDIIKVVISERNTDTIKSMDEEGIVFALGNPDPEIPSRNAFYR
ncbi:MAG TPA: hypothetical protein VFI70_10635 [Nitrososphaeraceae archaeon]|nr:hypothetical protein [Nitrososphaeraceae archaeon]